MSERRDVEVRQKEGYQIIKFHGSVFGSCEHRQVFALANPHITIDVPVNEFQEGLFAKGHVAELWVKDQLAKSGWVIRGGGTEWKDQVTVSMWGAAEKTDNPRDRILLANHLDGHILKGDDQSYRLECKNLGSEGYAKLFDDSFAIDQYAWQMSSAAWGNERGEPGDYRKNPHPVALFVTNKDNYANKDLPLDERYFRRVITEPRYTAQECLDRCRRIIELAAQGIVPECDSYYPCKTRQWERDLATISIEDDDLAELVARYGERRAEVKFVTSQLDDVKVELKDMLERCGVEPGGRCIVDGVTISLSKNGRLTVTGGV